MIGYSTILIVDDEKNTREGLKALLVSLDYDVITASSGREAIGLIKEEKPDLALVDLRMPEMDGLTLLNEIKKLSPRTLIIILTAYGTVESAVQAMKAGAYYYLTKPINYEELKIILLKALHQKGLEHENIALRAELIQERHDSGKIIGNSESIKKMIALANQVAKTDSTVLIQGESGTGKELFAHLIYSESNRADRPFVPVHMAALTDTLLASELFGHEKGAFTGATERKIGRFERANGGTLFLDEIAEIPELMQTKLLRVLQTGEFERVGGTKTLRADVRLICATNKNLREEVAKGRFREDLYYRINVILLEIPPLRSRMSDVPLLASFYLEHFSTGARKNIKKITSEAMQKLMVYAWPGNVRELKNIIERAVVLSNSDYVGMEHLPDDLLQGAVVDRDLTESGQTLNSDQTLRGMEAQMIRDMLKNGKVNKSQIAKKLGISRRTLYRKLKEYEIK